jgi:hypothetical protein
MKKLMDLEASSLRTAEIKISIRDSLLRKITQHVVERTKGGVGATTRDVPGLRIS